MKFGLARTKKFKKSFKKLHLKDNDEATYIVPERKPLFRQNPNIKIRNPKQIRISNDKMTQTKTLKTPSFCHWDIGILVIVSYFVLRISNFLTEKTGFSVKH